MTRSGSHLDAAGVRVTFELVIAETREDDDPDAIAQLATELGAILDTANRAADAARASRRQPQRCGPVVAARGVVHGQRSRCPACSGVGAAIGQCADCGGAGSIP